MKSLLFGLSLGAALLVIGQTTIPPTQIAPASGTQQQILSSTNGKNGWVILPLSNLPTWAQEIPAGTLNGTNPAFTTSLTPIPNSLVVYRNGIALFPLASDYALAGNIITFTANAIPQTGDKLIVTYQHF